MQVHRITLQEKKALLPLPLTTGCDTISHFVGMREQKGYGSFDGRSPELLEHRGEESRPKANVLTCRRQVVPQ